MSGKLRHYLAMWNLFNPQRLARTATSDVFMVDHQGETVVLKLLTEIGIHDERCGVTALRHFKGDGAVHLLRHDDKAHLLEYVDGDDLIPMVVRGEDEAATIIIADVLKRLHRTETTMSADGLISLRRRFRALFNKAEHDQQHDIESIYVQAAQIADDLLTNQREVRVLHGDIHHANIKYDRQRSWLAIDPKGLYGERTFDVANILCNPISMPMLIQSESRLLRHTEILAAELNLEYDRILKYVFAYACLSACWSIGNPEEVERSLSIARLVQPHLT